jgi:hypothetical protein
MNVNSSNNTSKWQMGFNSAFKGLSKADVAGFKMCCDTHKGVNFFKCCTREAATEFSEKLLTTSIQINLKEMGGES